MMIFVSFSCASSTHFRMLIPFNQPVLLLQLHGDHAQFQPQGMPSVCLVDVGIVAIGEILRSGAQ